MDLQGEFALPRSQFYRYLQLRHALNLQFRLSKLILTDHAIVREALLATDKRGMISGVYSILLSALQDTSALPRKKGWEKDVGDIDGDTWKLCPSSAPLVSVSATQKLSHLFFAT